MVEHLRRQRHPRQTPLAGYRSLPSASAGRAGGGDGGPSVEHNRWNVERLLMGYRPATTAERERANADDEYNEMLKKKYFIHINIAPYGEIPEETKENDRILTRFLYRVEQ